MAKQTAEGSNRLSIFWLKKNDFFPIGGGWRYGGIKWTYEMSGNESSISFTITTNGSESDNIKLQYTHTNRQTDEKEDMDFRVGKYCGRRVGVLFSIGKWFGCRHCGEIAYAAQMESGKFRWNGISIKDIERAEKEVKRCYYNGKPTRKYKRLIRLNEKFESSFIMMAAHLDKRSNRLAGLKK